MTTETKSVPSISVTYAQNGSSTKANALEITRLPWHIYVHRVRPIACIVVSGERSAKPLKRFYMSLNSHRAGRKHPEKSIDLMLDFWIGKRVEGLEY